ncbi:hypothetical protein PQR64_11350 [Paraburkholderia phytofirmans]|uniref:hypothetical protein n=1 Tax=Paraburkholderia phytofirmans TaxID=261302 RepID=UPI0038BAB34D
MSLVAAAPPSAIAVSLVTVAFVPTATLQVAPTPDVPSLPSMILTMEVLSAPSAVSTLPNALPTSAAAPVEPPY